jgi:hypothetical protein
MPGRIILLCRNDPDLVEAFLKKWWIVTDFARRQQRSIILPGILIE